MSDDVEQPKYQALADFVNDQTRQMGAHGIVLLVLDAVPGSDNKCLLHCHQLVDDGVQQSLPRLLRDAAEHTERELMKERFHAMVRSLRGSEAANEGTSDAE